MTHRLAAAPLGFPATALGECPLWHAGTGTFHWIDIVAGELLSLMPDAESPRCARLGDRIGSIAPRAGGGLVAAVDCSLLLLDRDLAVETRIEAPWKGDGSLVNDGACDVTGRFWVGTAVSGGEPRGRLFSYRGDEGWIERLAGIGQSNGIGWSPDSSTLYHVDSSLGRLDGFEFDAENGVLGDRHTVVSLEPPNEIPDGLTVDSQGALWLAVFGTGEVRRYSEAGAELASITVAASHVTSCAFVGPDLQTLHMTSGYCELEPGRRALEPMAGRVFAARPGVRGLPEPVFAG